MSKLHSVVYDHGLFMIPKLTTKLVILTSDPASYSAAVADTKGHKDAPIITGPANDSGTGRKVTIDPITDGIVDVSGNVGFWACLDDISARLIACGPLDAVKAVIAADAFTLSAIDISIPGVP